MGGDHKCPVCQATFTRPQHVARHMRSHTGDRPYKCVHCGDQFARSDLLSRHVNKCHASEKQLSAGNAGRRKGTTAATRATTSKQACDQCVQSSLPCDGSNPCAKCVARKTRCTFVKFHRQTAPVGPGHPSSLSASSLPSTSGLPSMGGASTSHLPPAPYGALGLDAHTPPFLYAQQAASGAGFAFPSGGSPSPTQAHASVPGYPADYPPRDTSIREGYYPPPPGSYYSADYDAYRDHPDRFGDASSEHSGSVSAGSRPASSAGLSDFGAYHGHHLPGANGRHSLDLHAHSRHPDLRDLQHSDLRHASDVHGGRPPEFSNAFGLMSLDDPNVLAGLSSDGVPFFSNTSPVAAHPHTGLTPRTHADALDSLKRAAGPGMPLVPPAPLAYQPYGPPPPGSAGSGAGGTGAQTPGTREAETRELREFWKAYMRTPLTGPGSSADPLGLQTPSASASAAAAAAGGGILAGGASGPSAPGNGTRRYRVSSLPTVRTPEGELDAAPTFPVHPHASLAPPLAPRMLHNADDLRSYEAAVLARKAPELVLRKPTKRPTTSAGHTSQSHSPPQQQQQTPMPQQPPRNFDFNAMSRERSTDAASSSLAGAFGLAGYGITSSSAVPAAPGSGPNSPFPGTPTSVSTSASEEGDPDDNSEDGASGGGRPNFKRLPSQTLGPPQTKRRRKRPREIALGTPPVGAAAATAASGGGGLATDVSAYPDRPMIPLRGGAHHPHAHAHGHGHEQVRRARRLSAPASPTSPGFVIN